MSRDRWEQLERIFLEARQVPDASRAAFVTSACEGDAALRLEALSLLSAADGSSDFLETPALERLARTMAAEGSSLQPGQRLGAYTVVRLLGSGGAGEVWRARDDRLRRDVAIKVLLRHAASDADRRRRFADEARTAGALNHPNILTVYDVGEHRGIPFLVSECLEGQTLRTRLEAGPLPPDQALDVALGMAHGLAAAHKRGIIHRDLKPENVFIRSDSGVKLLDFGVAKLQPERQAEGAHTLSGVIVGTARYMAPEQARGEAVDVRSDLFAVGITAYEMLAGQHPFGGASTFETLHAILTADPQDLASVNPQVPLPLARIVMRLLKKPPEARVQCAADLAWMLEEVAHDGARAPIRRAPRDDTPVRRPPRRRAWLLVPGLAATFMFGGWWLGHEARPERGVVPLMRFTWSLPAGMVLDSAPVISPDGQSIAVVGRDDSGTRLFVRPLAGQDVTAVPGTDGAKQPFWSPDGRYVGFFARGELMKVLATGGAPIRIGDAPDGHGGSWSRSGTILVQPRLIESPLVRLSADGGPAEPAALLNVNGGDRGQHWPHFLPDGVTFLYLLRSAEEERNGVYVARIDHPPALPARTLIQAFTAAVYAPLPGGETGALLYVRHGRLEARRFDPARLAFLTEARVIAEPVGGHTPFHEAMVSASANVLAYAESPVPFGNQLVWAAPAGGPLRRLGEPGIQNWPRISRDGRKLARQRIDSDRNNPDIWVDDLERGSHIRITTAPYADAMPAWSPDGRRLAFTTGPLEDRVVAVAAADGTGILFTMPCPQPLCEITDWSRDGTRLILNVRGREGTDVWSMTPEPTSTSRPLLTEPFTERDAKLSPDGRWIAYVSEETGRPEVSIRSITGTARRLVVSSGGGDAPVWRPDGTELFFIDSTGRLKGVRVIPGARGELAFGAPLAVNIPPLGRHHWGTQYDVAPDGRVFFLLENESQAPRDIQLVLGWSALLE